MLAGQRALATLCTLMYRHSRHTRVFITSPADNRTMPPALPNQPRPLRPSSYCGPSFARQRARRTAHHQSATQECASRSVLTRRLLTQRHGRRHCLASRFGPSRCTTQRLVAKTDQTTAFTPVYPARVTGRLQLPQRTGAEVAPSLQVRWVLLCALEGWWVGELGVSD